MCPILLNAGVVEMSPHECVGGDGYLGIVLLEMS